MNKILLETHKNRNIDLLRVRDLYFNKCRKLNVAKNICQIIPIVVLFVSYVPFVSTIGFVNDYRDYYSGGMAIISFIAIFFLNNVIEGYLQISNAFREEYDVCVFGLRRNEYLYDKKIIQKYEKTAQKVVEDSSKYEYWYEEIFSDNHPNNVICCQMDNIIYTYHVYKKTRNVYSIVSIAIFFVIMGIWIWLKDANFIILSFLTLFNVFQSFIEYIDTSKNLVEKNELIFDRILSDCKTTYTMEDARNIQDCIFSNREEALFIPKFIRNKYLKDGNTYYKDLDKIKEKLIKDKNVTIPSSSDEIEVLSKDGTKSVRLSILQERLKEMLQDIKVVFEENNINYTLDGGTLIGAVREDGKYIFWDDDVDIAIKYEDYKIAREVLFKTLSEKYEFQDCDNEKFYSPRLSSLRMREKNEMSVLCERDSALCELYEKRGLFVDIYVYSPIAINRVFDSVYRRLKIHPINRKIYKTEKMWKLDETKYEKKFLKIKKKYQKRVEKYLSFPQNSKYYVYVPYYIENLKKAGPYIKKEDLYGEEKLFKFEGEYYRIPTNYNEVLKAYYGEKWDESPFKSLKDYKHYSEKKFAVTKLKHIIYIDDKIRK